MYKYKDTDLSTADSKKECTYKTSVAIKRGILRRKEMCDWCDGSDHIHVHHPDYAKPLTVFWLCRSCHLVRLHGTKSDFYVFTKRLLKKKCWTKDEFAEKLDIRLETLERWCSGHGEPLGTHLRRLASLCGHKKWHSSLFDFPLK